MKLWALSDLHLPHRPNREAMATVSALPDDWLVLAGDVADGHRGLDWCFDTLNGKFNQLVRVHLHIRGTSWIDGVPFQEVSLGYPNQRDLGRGIGHYLHEVVLAPAHDSHEDG